MSKHHSEHGGPSSGQEQATSSGMGGLNLGADPAPGGGPLLRIPGLHQGKAEPRVPDLVVDMGASTEVWQGPPPRTHVAATNRLGEKGLCHEADWERRTSQADLV